MIFGFFRLFLINIESFRVQCFGPPFPEVFKDSRLNKSLGTFYESLKKYGAKNIKKVIDLHRSMSILYICEKRKEQAFHYKKLEVI